MIIRRGARVATLLLLLPAACLGLSKEDQARLDLHRQNALTYFDSGSYPQALQQSEKALELDDDAEGMQLVHAASLLRLGKAAGDVRRVEASMAELEILDDSLWRETDHRVPWLLAQAQLARAFMHDDAIERIEKRLASSRPRDEAERELDEVRLAREQARRLELLTGAEENLRRTLADGRQADNHHVLTDLVVVLNSIGGREDEVLEVGRRALGGLDSSNETWRQLQRVPNRTAARKLEDDRQIEFNLAKERQLRDILVTILYERGELDAALAEYAVMEQRQLMMPVQYYNRAGIYEQLGLYGQAITDLQQFLRIRSRHLEYEDDAMAPQVFEKLDELRRRADVQAAAP